MNCAFKEESDTRDLNTWLTSQKNELVYTTSVNMSMLCSTKIHMTYRSKDISIN